MSTNKPLEANLVSDANSQKQFRVGIVGGGVTGLSAAFEIEQLLPNRVSIDLFESSDRLGGKVHTVLRDEMILETGAESFLSRKLPGLDLCRELGLLAKLQGMRPENKKTFIWHDERMHRLPEGLTGFVPGNIKSLFSSTLLGLSGKLRVAADWIIPATKSEEDESLASFMTRRLGKQAYNRLVQPLLCGIYAADGSQLSLKATYPELQALEKKHGSLIRGLRHRQKAMREKQAARANSNETTNSPPPFVTLPGGMAQLIDALQAALSATKTHLNQPVVDLQQNESNGRTEWQLTTNKIEGAKYDAIILTCPAFTASKIVGKSLPELASTLNQIPHVSTITANVWYDTAKLEHELDGYGFVVPAEEQKGVTAVTWTSSKHFGRCPEKRKLIRAYVGRAGAEADCSSDDGEVMQIVKRELRRFMGISVEPDGFLLQRWPKGSPQYQMSHPAVLKNIEDALSSLNGLQLCGASYRGVGIPDCIRDGRLAANNIVNQWLN